MSKVTQLQEVRALKRKKRERGALSEINAYVNHHPEEWDKITSVKTLHEGVDLRCASGKYTRLVEARFHRARMNWAINAERVSCLLVSMPDGVYVLDSADDFVYRLDDYPRKIVKMTVDNKIGVWESVGA